MKNLLKILFLLPSLILAEQHHISMTNNKFDPDNIVISVGDEIIFTNKDNAMHNVVIPDLKVRSKYLKKDQQFSVVIEQDGTFDFYCEPHRTMGMTGKIESTLQEKALTFDWFFDILNLE